MIAWMSQIWIWLEILIGIQTKSRKKFRTLILAFFSIIILISNQILTPYSRFCTSEWKCSSFPGQKACTFEPSVFTSCFVMDAIRSQDFCLNDLFPEINCVTPYMWENVVKMSINFCIQWINTEISVNKPDFTKKILYRYSTFENVGLNCSGKDLLAYFGRRDISSSFKHNNNSELH